MNLRHTIYRTIYRVQRYFIDLERRLFLKYDSYIRSKSTVDFIVSDNGTRYCTADVGCRIKEIDSNIYEVKYFDPYKKGAYPRESREPDRPNKTVIFHTNGIKRVVLK